MIINKEFTYFDNLYPIGTELITRRLSQAALYKDIFEEDPDSLIEGEIGNFQPWVSESDDWLADAWSVTVTKENQKWLSPVPMVGDLLEFKDPDSWLKSGDWDTYGMARVFGKQVINRFTIACPSMVQFLIREPKYRSEHPCLRKIVERTYPNGQRAPLIEWDWV